MHTPLHNTNTKSMSTKLFYDCTTSNSVDVERMSVETETLCILQKLGVGDVGSMVTSDIQFVQYYHYRLLSISSLHRQVLKFVRQYRRQAGAHVDTPISLQLCPVAVRSDAVYRSSIASSTDCCSHRLCRIISSREWLEQPVEERGKRAASCQPDVAPAQPKELPSHGTVVQELLSCVLLTGLEEHAQPKDRTTYLGLESA